MKITRLTDKRAWSLGCALLRREDVVADEGEWAARLWAMADLATPMAVRVAATLRLADHVMGGRRTTSELAEATDVDADALDRVLRHLVTAGVLRRDQSDRYVLTAQGQALQDDHPAGMRAMLDLEGAIGRADLSFVQLLHTVRTGEPAFPAQFGRSFWDDLAADPTRSASFDALMATDVEAWAPDILSAYNWGSLGHLVDVGGGNGALLIAMLHRYPDLRGTVLDLPGATEAARKALTAAGLADRSDAMAGSFFDPLPPGAGGYLLCAVLHDWDDAPARAILRRCGQAAGTDGRVFVVEKLVTDTDHRTEMDLRVLAYFGGRERDLAELTALAAAAGLRVAAVHPAGATPVVELTAL
jgi:DNA-binding transcriptional ArsR family regulator